MAGLVDYVVDSEKESDDEKPSNTPVNISTRFSLCKKREIDIFMGLRGEKVNRLRKIAQVDLRQSRDLRPA